MTNLEIARLLRHIAAAYQILNENRFKIIAYERAADSIEHLASEVKDLWDDGKLGEISGIGASIAGHLDELFRTGKVKHFESVLSRLPQGIFPLLDIAGLGPKKAHKLVTALKLKSAATVIDDLDKAAKEHKIAPIDGFGDKSEADILAAIASYRKGAVKERRMTLYEADITANAIVAYLSKNDIISHVDKLGSLRRQVSTVGDIDIAVATTDPQNAIQHFIQYPHQKIIEQGPTGASLLLSNNRQVDMRVGKPNEYGAMLQYFTGSKHHNIKLRTLALQQGFSLSEYGIKDIKTGKLRTYPDEELFYHALKLSYIAPEFREDTGEIEAAQSGKLPDIITLRDIQGDLHIHTSFNLQPSHDLGENTLKEYLNKAEKYIYEYIGISDHNPSISNHNNQQIIDIMKRRKEFYEQEYYSYKLSTKKRVHIFIMLEVDIQPDGNLALPEKAFEYVDAVIASVHSSFHQNKQQMTNRVTHALQNHPKVKILGHPTGRLLTRREGYELDWEQIFAVCIRSDIALEINSYPNRLDLPDVLVRDAVKSHVKCCINTDAHAVGQIDFIPYGVSVARRGWATKRDIVNTLGYNDFKKWLTKT